MRRFLWVLGATLILALLPLTGHIAFAAERPQTAVIGASATTDTHAEATTDPAVATRSNHADRHDASDATDADDAAPVSDDTGDARASRHTADDGGTTASGDEQPARHQDQSDGDTGGQSGPPAVAIDQGDEGNQSNESVSQPVAAPVADGGTEPAAHPDPQVGIESGQTTEPAAPDATGTDVAPTDPAPAAPAASAAPMAGPGSADRGGDTETPSGTTATAPTDQATVAVPPTTDPAATESDSLDAAPSLPSLTILPPVQHDLDRLIARLTVQGLCIPSGAEPGDLSCGGGAIQLCLRATTTGLSLSCATPGGGTAPGGAGSPGTSSPPPVTQPGGSQPGGNQPGGDQPGGVANPDPSGPPVASGPVASTSDLGISADSNNDLDSIGQFAGESESGNASVASLGRPLSFAPSGTGLNQSVAAHVAALPSAPVTSTGPNLIGLRVTKNVPGLASLIRPGNAFVTQFGPKLSVLSLVDHAPQQPQLPALVAPRLPMLDPFADLPAVTMSAAAGPVPGSSTGGAESVAVAAPVSGVQAAAAPVSQPVPQPPASRALSPFLPVRSWSGTGTLPAADVPSPVTPLRLLLVLLASGCFVAAAMMKRNGQRPRAAPAARRPSRLI